MLNRVENEKHFITSGPGMSPKSFSCLLVVLRVVTSMKPTKIKFISYNLKIGPVSSVSFQLTLLSLGYIRRNRNLNNENSSKLSPQVIYRARHLHDKPSIHDILVFDTG